MELCSSGHDEVCYETHKCPACVEIKDRDKQIQDHLETMDILEKRVRELEREVEERS